MKFSCPECKLAGNIDDTKIPAQGTYATCPKCKTRFLVKAEESVVPAVGITAPGQVIVEKVSASPPLSRQSLEQKEPTRPQNPERPGGQARTRPNQNSKAETGSSMNKGLMIIVAVLTAIAVQWVVRTVIFAAPTFDKQIVKACNEINKATPIVVDKYTRLDTSVPGPGKQITYLYTLTDIEESNITTEVKANIEAGVRKQVAQSSDLKLFRDNGVAMAYVYRMPDAKEVFKFTIKH